MQTKWRMWRILLTIVLLWSVSFGIPKKYPCPFCDPSVWERQQFYEDAYIRGLNDIRLRTTHRLIIPKRHVTRFEDLTDEELLAVKHLVKNIQTPHYWILQKNNLFQSVPHVHFHLFSKPEKQSSFAFFVSFFGN